MFVEEDIVQPVALVTADSSLSSAPGLAVSPLSSTTLGSEAVVCSIPSGLHFKWHSCAIQDIPLEAVLCLAGQASKRAEVRRFSSILRARPDIANQHWKKYSGEAVVRTAPSDILREVFFVFSSWEVRYYNQEVFLLARRSGETTGFASTATSVDEFKTLPSDGYDARYEPTASNARRRFNHLFGFADHHLLPQSRANAIRVAPATLLHERADLELSRRYLLFCGTSMFPTNC